MRSSLAVVFDLGKVLLDFDYQIAGEKLALRSTSSARELTHFLLQPRVLLDYESGLTSREQFFATFCAGTGYTGTIEEFGDSFGDIFSPIDPMIALHAELRARQFCTYIFSNTNELAIGHIRRSFPFFDHFDGYILSYEHRLMKPDSALYEVVEKIAGRRGPDLLYIDDRPENVETGKSRGWQTILHVSPEATYPQVAGLLRL